MGEQGSADGLGFEIPQQYLEALRQEGK